MPFLPFSAESIILMRIRSPLTRSRLSLAWVVVLVLAGCDARPRSLPEAKPSGQAALLLVQAQFVEKKKPDGRTTVVPGPAKLTFLYPNGSRWTTELLQDPTSTVFHKAMPFDLPGEQPGILTISGNRAPQPAMLKVWRRGPQGWKGTLLWEARFGGEFNRFRDVEIGDVTGDNIPDVVIATHDQGVVAVLHRKGEAWETIEIDRAPDTWVHEIEIGDVDGDGSNEIFATPSAPNRIDGTPQPSRVVMYRYDGKGFSRQVVEEFVDRPVKEILVAKVKDAARPDLYAVLEIPLGPRTAPGGERESVEIRQYRFTGAGFASTLIATLPDKQCRFLNAGDVDADGKPELIASAFKSGIWMIKPERDKWVTHLIDEDSSGYEHPAALADINSDGTQEIYVATDDKQLLRRYRWTGEEFERTDLLKLNKGDIAFALTTCSNPRCLTKE